MPSLIGKALRIRNAASVPPVPYGTPGLWHLPGLGLTGGAGAETFMRAQSSTGTIWQIVHLLSSSVAKPEWRLYRKQKTDGRVRYTTNDQGSDMRTEVLRHAALTVLKRPNPFWSRFALFEASQQYVELTGESTWVLDFGKATFPVGIWPVRPDSIEPVPDKRSYLKGWVYTAPDGHEQIPLEPREVIQVRLPNPLDPYRGMGPVQAILPDADSAKYAGEWNRNFFLNSATPGGIIQVPESLDDDDFARLRDRWRDAHRGVARSHRVGILEGGATWVPNGNSMKDMDFANLRNEMRDLIREAWGVHKIMLGNSDDVNRANAQTGEEVFANWSVVPRLDRWKIALNEQFLPLYYASPDQVDVEFDYIYPLPANREQDNAELTAKSAAALTLRQAGYDPDDVLTTVGLPKMRTAAAPAAAPGSAPEGQDAGEQDAESQGGGDSPALNRILNAPSLTKAAVNYRAGTDARHCGNCDMYHDRACDLVKGEIDPAHVCNRWEPSMENRLRKVLGNGHKPIDVEVLREMAEV